MKTLSSFILSFIIIIGIAACDSSTMADTQEGKRIGTWMVYDTEADWVGTRSQSKAKGLTTQAFDDTVYYAQPDSNSINLLQPNGWPAQSLRVRYTDSTYNKNTYTWGRIENTLGDESFDLEVLFNDHIELTTGGFTMHCDSIYSDNETITITYFNPADSVHIIDKVVVLNATGIIDAAKNLVGCQN